MMEFHSGGNCRFFIRFLFCLIKVGLSRIAMMINRIMSRNMIAWGIKTVYQLIYEILIILDPASKR